MFDILPHQRQSFSLRSIAETLMVKKPTKPLPGPQPVIALRLPCWPAKETLLVRCRTTTYWARTILTHSIRQLASRLAYRPHLAPRSRYSTFSANWLLYHSMVSPALVKIRFSGMADWIVAKQPHQVSISTVSQAMALQKPERWCFWNRSSKTNDRLA